MRAEETTMFKDEKQKIVRFRFTAVPNNEARISQLEKDGWELYGYSDYDSEGFPWKAEFRKTVYKKGD